MDMTTRLEAAIAELAAALLDELRAESRPAAPDELLDIDTAASRLSLGRSLVYREIAAGRLASLKVGRRRLVSSGAIAEYIHRHAA